ncbi:MAG TPA: Bro-N domain-containing protein [Desulfitobacterium dehalogenans]|uniref:Bro-N domain-containing protein n=1 Tax=Desulfitobacterium dehalogenans TaxID=36854 RepID=A0A7C7D9B4_9FIRM|nr:Bro-N domain-containing protein [Desulfitobacterium dehalogenans]
MNDLIVKNFNGTQVHTFIWNGRPCWIANEVVSLFKYANPSVTIHDCIIAEDFESGIEYETLRGEDLKVFKKMVNSLTNLNLVSPNTPNLTIFYEDGLYGFLQYTDKPEGIQFRKWIRREVLPEIRETGAYIAPRSVAKLNDSQKLRAEAMHLNAKTNQAKLLKEIAVDFKDKLSEESVQLLIGGMAEIIIGKPLFPLLAVEKTYTATEIGTKLGISANRVGKIANANGLKTEEYGIIVLDKSPHSAKQVPSFRYNERGRQKLTELIVGGGKENG